MDQEKRIGIILTLLGSNRLQCHAARNLRCRTVWLKRYSRSCIVRMRSFKQSTKNACNTSACETNFSERRGVRSEMGHDWAQSKAGGGNEYGGILEKACCWYHNNITGAKLNIFIQIVAVHDVAIGDSRRGFFAVGPFMQDANAACTGVRREAARLA